MNPLRELALASSKEDPRAKLEDAALLVRRAGLEHLVIPDDGGPITVDEINALAKAGETLAAERVVMFFTEARAPGSIGSVLDGGKSFLRAILAREIRAEVEMDAARGRASGVPPSPRGVRLRLAQPKERKE